MSISVAATNSICSKTKRNLFPENLSCQVRRCLQVEVTCSSGRPDEGQERFSKAKVTKSGNGL